MEIHAAAELTFDSLKDERTCGFLGACSGGASGGAAAAMLVAEPVGVVAGVLSATDPCASVRQC